MLGLALRSQILFYGVFYGVFCESVDCFLKLLFLHIYEGVELVEVSVYDDVVPPYFSAVTDGCAVYISVLSVEEGFNSGS